MDEDSTMQFFTNLDRKGIEAKLREARAMAESGKFTAVVSLLTSTDGKSRADLEQCVKQSLSELADTPGSRVLVSNLEMIQVNLPNL